MSPWVKVPECSNNISIVCVKKACLQLMWLWLWEEKKSCRLIFHSLALSRRSEVLGWTLKDFHNASGALFMGRVASRNIAWQQTTQHRNPLTITLWARLATPAYLRFETRCGWLKEFYIFNSSVAFMLFKWPHCYNKLCNFYVGVWCLTPKPMLLIQNFYNLTWSVKYILGTEHIKA